MPSSMLMKRLLIGGSKGIPLGLTILVLVNTQFSCGQSELIIRENYQGGEGNLLSSIEEGTCQLAKALLADRC